MNPSGPNRREFAKLAAAAVGGILAGAAEAVAADAADDKKTGKKSPLLYEPHVCRGLNTCKNKGKSGQNACAGQGQCATVKAHTCSGDNECRGQGGCGTKPAENACKGQGSCHVPLDAKAWPKARKRFETLMSQEDKKVGAAPPKKGG